MKEFTIGQNDAGQRLDKFLGKAVPLLPSSMMYKGIRTKRIKVNSKRAEISTRLAVGDVVSLYLNDEFFEEKRADETFLRAGDALSGSAWRTHQREVQRGKDGRVGRLSCAGDRLGN